MWPQLRSARVPEKNAATPEQSVIAMIYKEWEQNLDMMDDSKKDIHGIQLAEQIAAVKKVTSLFERLIKLQKHEIGFICSNQVHKKACPDGYSLQCKDLHQMVTQLQLPLREYFESLVQAWKNGMKSRAKKRPLRGAKKGPTTVAKKGPQRPQRKVPEPSDLGEDNIETRETSAGHGDNVNVRQLSEEDRAIYLSQIPLVIWPYVKEIKDVLGDGHCGYRAIAMLLGWDVDGWRRVRSDLLEELHSHRKLYLDLYQREDAINEHPNIDRLERILQCYHKPCTKDHWMDLPDMGHIIASCYSVLLVTLSAGSCFTFFPLRTGPPPQKEIAIAYVNRGHFIPLYLDKGHPLPPVATMWRDVCSEEAREFDVTYSSRLEMFPKPLEKNVDLTGRASEPSKKV